MATIIPAVPQHIWLPDGKTEYAQCLPLFPEKWDALEATHPKVSFGKYLDLNRARKAIEKKGNPIASKYENRGLYLKWEAEQKKARRLNR